MHVTRIWSHVLHTSYSYLLLVIYWCELCTPIYLGWVWRWCNNISPPLHYCRTQCAWEGGWIYFCPQSLTILWSLSLFFFFFPLFLVFTKRSKFNFIPFVLFVNSKRMVWLQSVTCTTTSKRYTFSSLAVNLEYSSI